jgi:hypothetical protein
MPIIGAKGSPSSGGFGQFAQSGAVNYIEDVFSTYLYTGNGSTQTITNGIDLSTKGGLVWAKFRDISATHMLFDTINGVNKYLATNDTNPINTAAPNTLTAFNTNGFSLGSAETNYDAEKYVSWTFRKQPKFFDVVTYTGDGTSGRTVSHNLGSVPGCIIVKSTSNSGSWFVYHRGANGGVNSQNYYLTLNTTGAQQLEGMWGFTAPTTTDFTVTGASANNNITGVTYIAYLFAHDAGGFGLTGTDNVISCGSYTGSGSVDTITLGYEPQWILMKRTNTTGSWRMFDNMRGMSYTDNVYLDPATSGAEVSYGTSYVRPTPTGFTVQPGFYGTGADVIYIAIRRGPMKVPTDATKVFSPTAANNSLDTKNTTNFPIDLQLGKYRNIDSNILATDRLRGISTTSTSSGQQLRTNTTNAEDSGMWTRGWDNTGFLTPVAYADTPTILWNFQRAPSFFDEVCYTGDGVDTRMLNHNLNAQPELIISKNRQGVQNWQVIKFAPAVTTTSGTNYWIQSISTAGALYVGTIDSTFGPSYSAPTSTQYPVGIVSGSTNGVNASSITYVAYLFATCAGVSKVGSYTGTGTTLQVNCGFTAGSRFVMIKRTDSTGDWYVWDSARGIVAGNDPYLLLNSTAAEVTNTDYVDTYSAGFEISSTAPAAINASGGTYIFLAIA